MLHAFLFLTDVNFEFTENDCRAIEPDPANPNPSLPVVVLKSGRIASRVELAVVPLTVQEARATSLPEPPNVPMDDMNSPPFASKKTFAMSIYYHEDVS